MGAYGAFFLDRYVACPFATRNGIFGSRHCPSQQPENGAYLARTPCVQRADDRPNETATKGDEQPVRTREWASLPGIARAYTVVVTAAGAGVLYGALRPSVDFVPTVLSVAAMAALTASLRMPLPKMRAGATLSASFIVNFASLLTLGANATTLVAIAGALSQSIHGLKSGRQLYRTLFNVACLVITVQAAAFTFHAMGGVTGTLSWPNALPPLAGAVITYFAVNTGFVATAIALCTSRPVGTVWQESFLGSGPSYFIGAAFATAVAGTIVIGHWEILMAVAVPAGLSLWAYKVHAESSLALQRSEERYALAASGANDGLWDWDLATNTIHLSARWRTMLGLTEMASPGGPEEWLNRVHPDDLAALTAALNAHTTGQTDQVQHEHRILHCDGSYRWFLCRGAAVRGADGRATRIAGSLTDVTERIRAQEALWRAAQHDTLTGLPNRALFVELLQQALNHGRRNPEVRSAVLFLDLDGFKIVNDTLGHVIGDELLVVTSKRLRSCLRDSDTLARLGGDEFVILLQDPRSVCEATLVADRIQRAVQAPLSLGGRDIFVSASIGIAMSSDNYTDPIVIMRDADAAMYKAKAAGKARYVLFNDGMHQQVLDRQALEHHLREAITHDGLAVCYQPIVNLTTRRVVSFEALARWTREGQDVPPSVFIPVAEELGLMDELGAWVLRTACREFALLRDRFPAACLTGIGVNVSSGQLTQPSFVSVVVNTLRDTQLPPSALHIEIAEAAFVKNPDAVTAVLFQLHAAGVRISVGDFGTGLSSLSHLHRVPIDLLKIDRPLVETLTNPDRLMTVESILAVAKTIGCHVSAEGVETDAQLLELKRLGCDHAQGFLFSRPLSTAAVEAYLERAQAPTAAASGREAKADQARPAANPGSTAAVTLH